MSLSPVTIGELLRAARQRLAAAPFEPERREATLLLARVLDDVAGELAHVTMPASVDRPEELYAEAADHVVLVVVVRDQRGVAAVGGRRLDGSGGRACIDRRQRP